MIKSLVNRLKPPVKVHWWRLEGSTHGNFGDEITKEIIENIFKRRVTWTPADACDIIGAGSIIEEVTQNKGSNRPYLWSSGFIQPGDLTISDSNYKVLGVRGKESLKRVTNATSDIVLGDAGLLASYLLKTAPDKQYKLGILPHYVDIDHPLIEHFAGDPSVIIIDATWPCQRVVEEIAKCDAVFSSSLHGLIVSDSLNVPNAHLRLSENKIKGGLYKFNDYYSIYSDSTRYIQQTPDNLTDKSAVELRDTIISLYKSIPVDELNGIKNRLLRAFPFH